jgi:hypothetical protein
MVTLVTSGTAAAATADAVANATNAIFLMLIFRLPFMFT